MVQNNNTTTKQQHSSSAWADSTSIILSITIRTRHIILYVQQLVAALEISVYMQQPINVRADECVGANYAIATRTRAGIILERQKMRWRNFEIPAATPIEARYSPAAGASRFVFFRFGGRRHIEVGPVA